MAGPIRRFLRDAMASADGSSTEVTSAVVSGVDETGNPFTVTLQFSDGLTVPGVAYPGWWAPRVGDVAVVLMRDGVATILHAVAPCLTVTSPHTHSQSDITGTSVPSPPSPAPVPTPPAPTPSIRTVTVQPTDMASWDGASFLGSQIVQGGPACDAFWFYGGAIAAARGSGVITGGTIYIQRLALAHGVAEGANVRLGTHDFTSRPAVAVPVVSVSVVGQLRRGQGVALPLSTTQIDALNAGAKGLGLGRGSSSFASPDFLRALATAPSGALSLTVLG